VETRKNLPFQGGDDDSGRGEDPKGSGGAEKVAGRTQAEAEFELRLYVAGQTSRSLAAFANLKNDLEEHLAGRYRIEVVRPPQESPACPRRPDPGHSDAGEEVAGADQKIIGDLSDTLRVLVGLDIRPTS